MEPIEKTEKLDHRHYIALLNNAKKRVDLAQQRLAATANEEMLRMYWDIGEMLHASQNQTDGATRPCNGCRPTSKMSIPT